MISLKTFLTLSVFALLIIIAKSFVTKEQEAVLSKLGLTQNKLLEAVEREWTKEEIKEMHALLQTMDKERWVKKLPEREVLEKGGMMAAVWDKLENYNEKHLFLIAIRKALDEIDDITEQEEALLTKLDLGAELVAVVERDWTKEEIKEWHALLQKMDLEFWIGINGLPYDGIERPYKLPGLLGLLWDFLRLNSEEMTIFLVAIEKALEEVLEKTALMKVGLTEKKLVESLERDWTREGVKLWYEALSWLDYEERRVFLAALGNALDEVIALKELGLTMDNLIAAVKEVGVSEVEKLLKLSILTNYRGPIISLHPVYRMLTLLNGTAKTDNGEKVNLFKNLIQEDLGWQSDIFGWQEKFERDIKIAVEVVKKEEYLAQLAKDEKEKEEDEKRRLIKIMDDRRRKTLN